MNKGIYYLLILFVCFTACHRSRDQETTLDKKKNSKMVFDAEKWKVREGKDYPYRSKMLHNVLYNDSIRKLRKDEIIELLGKPDRSHENYLYYQITQKRIGLWPLHTKTMVIKFYKKNKSIEWIKIHQ